MVKMIATKPHTYGGKTIEAGAEYEVEDQYAGTLVSLGRASYKDNPKGTKANPTTTQSTEENGDDKKTYRTRRVKAEDEE